MFAGLPQEMVVKKPSDCLVIDTAPEMLEEHGEAKLVLKLGARLALPNYALENYASRFLTTSGSDATAAPFYAENQSEAGWSRFVSV